MLTIYDSNGNRRTDIEAGDSSTQVKEVQGDNVLTLSFTHYEYIALDVNDRVDFEGERYWLTERYIPKQKSGQEWVYDLKFYGIESLVRRFLVLETTDGNTEPVFTLTATPREHVAMIVKCINDGMNHTTDWKVGRVDGTDLIVIDYEGKYCNEALKEIAEAVGGQAEWWVVTRNFAASLFRNIKYFTLRKLYLCRKWMQKRLQKTTTTGITLPNFDFLA